MASSILIKIKSIANGVVIKIKSEINKIFNFFKETKDFVLATVKEFKRLKIPTKAETLSYLIVVLLITFVSSIIFFAIDNISHKIITFILSFF